MTAYIRRLHACSQADASSANQGKMTANAAAKDRLRPLEDRLARLLATIPLDLQHAGLSLPALQAALRGRWRGHCHPGELGAALRKLGFRRERDWSGTGGFRAVWRR